MRTITLALTNFNRFALLRESFAQVIDDDRISEIVISDDCSDIAIYKAIKEAYKDIPKVKLHRNYTNQGVYRNKYHSVLHSKNEWVVVFDSDNVINKDYIDKLYEIEEWDKKTVYSPDWGKPEFDYRRFGGHTITRENVASFFHWTKFDCIINTMNCFVNRVEYLKVFDEKTEPIAADSAYFNYRWLDAGNKFYVVEGMRYQHLIHKGSHYVQTSHKSNAFHAELMYKFKHMS